jgi:hypothetical protein
LSIWANETIGIEAIDGTNSYFVSINQSLGHFKIR